MITAKRRRQLLQEGVYSLHYATVVNARQATLDRYSQLNRMKHQGKWDTCPHSECRMAQKKGVK